MKKGRRSIQAVTKFMSADIQAGSLVPIFAEIADKMPTNFELWGGAIVIGVFAAAPTAVLSSIRPKLGLIAVILTACFGIVAAWPDTTFDPMIREELADRYLWQQRIACAVPFVFSLVTWMIAKSIRNRTIHTAHDN